MSPSLPALVPSFPHPNPTTILGYQSTESTTSGCEAPRRDDGRAVVDLHGTPFVVLANQFKVRPDHLPPLFDDLIVQLSLFFMGNLQFAGWMAFGTWTYSNNAQLINLTGGVQLPSSNGNSSHSD
jgi:hypothetical protein